MKLLYGTFNPSKLQHMREMLQGLNIEIISLSDIGIDADIEECGTTPLENARKKALGYFKLSGMPTFACDSGLYIDGLNDEKQPGVHVRRIDNRYLNDEESIEYYSKLVQELGNTPKAKFKNAICLILDEKNIFEYDGDDIADHFLITSKVHSKRKPGFPLDSMSLDIESRKYIIDLGEHGRNEKEITKGFRNFFTRTILK